MGAEAAPLPWWGPRLRGALRCLSAASVSAEARRPCQPLWPEPCGPRRSRGGRAGRRVPRAAPRRCWPCRPQWPGPSPCRVDKEDVMTCLIKGCNFVLKNIPHEAFVCQKDSDPEFRFQTNHPNIFPYLLVNIGSGVSIVKVRLGFVTERRGGPGVSSTCCMPGPGWHGSADAGAHVLSAGRTPLPPRCGLQGHLAHARGHPGATTPPGPASPLFCARWRLRTSLSGSAAAPSEEAPSGGSGLCSPKRRYPAAMGRWPCSACPASSQGRGEPGAAGGVGRAPLQK